jgi:hypothetical protein
MFLVIIELGYQNCWYEEHITDEHRINKKIAEILNVLDEYEAIVFIQNRGDNVGRNNGQI